MLNTVVIGYVGEKGARDIRISIREYLQQWPGMLVSLLMIPVGGTDDDAYPVASSLDGDDIVWHVSSVDTQTAGTTKGTVRFNDSGGTVVLDEPFTVIVSSNLRVGAPPSDKLDPWFDQFTKNAAEELEKVTGAVSLARENAGMALAAAQTADNAAVNANAAVDAAIAASEAAHGSVGRADNAAESANSAAALASGAADAANEKAQAAVTATDVANESAARANNAAHVARDAAASAVVAAENTVEAIRAAQDAADAANSAAQSVGEAVTNVDEALRLAGESITKANDAAVRADASAAYATQQGTLAGAKANEADAAKVLASEAAADARSAADTARSAANSAGAAAGATNVAVLDAQRATAKATEAASRLDNLSVSVEMLDPSSAPVAKVEQTTIATSIKLMLPASNLAYATFEVSDDMELLMHTPDGYGGIEFVLNDNGELEVAI